MAERQLSPYRPRPTGSPSGGRPFDTRVEWVGDKYEPVPDLDSATMIADRLALMKNSQEKSKKWALPHEKVQPS
eukprot:458231-Prorocentrum_minimum.AAC.1